jgi:hypothetical protein
LPPESLDSINFTYQGIAFHVYGVLHGLTGGANRDYVGLVNRTVAQAPGFKLGEKEMTRIYKGLDAELQDWVQVPLRDAFRLGMSLVRTPGRLLTVAHSAIRELLTRNDKALTRRYLRLQDLGGSAIFHTAEPNERRAFAGFLPPAAYLKENLARRKGRSELQPPAFPDSDWQWLSFIEPYANIPCRSVHMLQYAATFAKLRGHTEVSLFVGEIHNTDIQWLATSERPELDARERVAVVDIERLAESVAEVIVQGRVPLARRFTYLASAAAGVSLPLSAYVLTVVLAVKYLYANF